MAQPVFAQPMSPTGFPQAQPGFPAPVGQPMAANQQFSNNGFGTNQPKTGPLYNEQAHRSLASSRQWSDGLFDCFNDGNTCICACCCPCISLYTIFDRLGQAGSCNKTTALFAYLFFAVVVDVVLSPLGFAFTWQAGQDQYGNPIMSGLRFGQIVSSIGCFIVLYMSIKAVKDKLYIEESDAVTCFKTCSCPQFCMCWACCALAQVARHVDRLQGFLPLTTYGMPAGQPLQHQMQMQQPQPGFNTGQGFNTGMAVQQPGQVIMAQPVQAVPAYPVVAQPIMAQPVMAQPMAQNPGYMPSAPPV